MHPRRFFSLALLLAWMVFVFGGYYLYHKPFSPEQFFVWAKAFYQTAVCALILLSAGGLGTEVFSRLGNPKEFSVTQSAGLGLGILSTAFLGISWALGVRWYFSLFLIGLAWVGCWRSVLRWAHKLMQVVVDMAPQSAYSAVLVALLVFLVLLSWLIAVSPPVAYDSLVYHLSLPLQYIQQGRFQYIPSNPFWGMPQLGEMLYTLAMSLAGLEAGAVLGWFLGCFALLGMAEMLRGYLTRSELWIALSTPLSGFTFVESLGWAYVDWIAFFWGVCILFSLKDALAGGSSRDVLLAGIFAGFALGTKYTAGVVVIAAACSILLILPRWEDRTGGAQVQGKGDVGKLRSVLHYGAALLVSSFPWWLKNFLAVGQPFYPLLFPAGEMSAQRIGFYAGLQPWGNLWTSLLLPLSATFLGVEGKEGFNASIGPLFLFLLPFSLLFSGTSASESERKLAHLSLLFGLVGWVVWGVGARLAGYLIQTRLYWSIVPSWVILSGLGYRKLCALELKPVRPWFLVNAVVLVVVGLNAVEMFNSVVQKQVFEYISGQTDAQAYLTHNLGWHFVAMQQVRRSGEGGSTLLLFEPRSLYCLPDCKSDELLDEWFTITQERSSTPERIIQVWKEQGFRRVLIFHQGIEFLRENDRRYYDMQWDLFERVVAQLSKEQDFGHAYSLYTLP